MAAHNLPWLFKHALMYVRDVGHQDPFSYFKLPEMTSPPTVSQLFPGYQGGVFDPLELGVACIVVPQPTGLGPNTKGSTFCLNQVLTPLPV